MKQSRSLLRSLLRSQACTRTDTCASTTHRKKLNAKVVHGAISPFKVVAANTALKLSATRPLDDEGKQRQPGDEWLFYGPATYVPRVEVQELETVRGVIVRPGQALRLQAKRDFVDVDGNKRSAGEEWLVNKEGSYIPGVDETVVTLVNAYVLTPKQALHLRALRNFTDKFGNRHKQGEEWLVTSEHSDMHIPDIYEHVVGVVNLISLLKSQYIVINDPYENGRPQFGKRKTARGETSFFLQPGEWVGNIENIQVLGADEAFYVRALETFVFEGQRNAGTKWLVRGPRELVPPVEMEIIRKKRAVIALEGLNVYVFSLEPFFLALFVLVLALIVSWFL
jgi:major vault protein